jgi:hypothetical protein
MRLWMQYTWYVSQSKYYVKTEVKWKSNYVISGGDVRWMKFIGG